MPLPLLAAGLALGGGLLKGFGGLQQSKFQAGLLDFNSQQSFRDAQIAEQNAEIKAKALRRSGRQLIGKQRVQIAKSGLRLEGTPLELMAESMENVELDAIAIKQKGEFRAKQLRVRAEFEKEQAGATRRAGTLGLITDVLGGATSAGSMFV